MKKYAAASMMALLSQKNITENIQTTTFSLFQRAPLCRDGAGNFDEQTSLKRVSFVKIHVQQV
jgi:hypothetical protein